MRDRLLFIMNLLKLVPVAWHLTNDVALIQFLAAWLTAWLNDCLTDWLTDW